MAYAPVLDGEFVSDDRHYVRDNPYVHELSLENLREFFDPGSVVLTLVENYAPVHLVLHALEWHYFGERVRGYHVVNVGLHALASWLLAAWLLRLGVARVAAAAAGAVFLLHAANVEAVAWISQLKSSASLVLALLALLARPRRPLVGTLCFALALLAKPSALFALPVAVVSTWSDPRARRSDWVWCGAWAAVFVGFAALELTAFARTAGGVPPLYAERWLRLRSAGAIGMRYLVMAATGYGLSTFHEPPPARSWLDPWWLGGVAVGGLLVWRLARTLRARRLEAAAWVLAAASWSAVSGLLPLPYPMADRYLYFILPGLLGGALLAGSHGLVALEAWARRRGLDAPQMRRAASRALAAGALVLVSLHAVRAHERAKVFRFDSLMLADAARNYPDGTAAKTLQAPRAARAGDVETAARLLREAHARGYNRLDQILSDPAYAPYLEDPRFRPLLVEIATGILRNLERSESLSQLELQVMALAHMTLDDEEAAVRDLERALEVGGPIDETIARDLAFMRRRLRLERSAAPPAR